MERNTNQEKWNDQIDSVMQSFVSEAASEIASTPEINEDMDQVDLRSITIARRLKETFPGQQEAILSLARHNALDKTGFESRIYQTIVRAFESSSKDLNEDQEDEQAA
jgi:hypothetical protein